MLDEWLRHYGQEPFKNVENNAGLLFGLLRLTMKQRKRQFCFMRLDMFTCIL